MIARLNNTLSSQEAEQLEQYLSMHPSARQEMNDLKKTWQFMDYWEDEPISEVTRSRISDMISDQASAEKHKFIFSLRPNVKTLSLVASIILTLGIGYWGFQNFNKEMNGQPGSSVQNSLHYKDNAGSRIQAIQKVALQTEINASSQNYLLDRLNHDPDTNVRLMALDMLLRQAGKSDLKSVILASLDQQNSPHVQWVMIHMAGVWKLKSAIPHLETLLNKPETDPFIKHRIRQALEEIRK